VTPDALAAELAAGKLRGAYLVAGPEPLLRDRAIGAIRAAAIGDGPSDFLLDRLEGETASAGALEDALAMLPAFAPRRLVWLREPAAGRSKALVEALPAIAKAQQGSTTSVLVASAAALDRRAAWVRAFGDAVVECEAPARTPELVAFAKREAERMGVKLGAGAAEALVERVGASLLGIHNEIEKTSLLAGPGQPIAARHVLESSSDVAEEPIWELTDAIGAGKSGDALRVLAKLLASGVPEMVLLGSLASHFRKLVRVRHGGAVPAAPFVQRKLESQARRYAAARLRTCLAAIHDTDEALKGQGALPPQLALERLVLGLSA
jgi:DNA polymerase-3 subunit delta